MQQNQRKKGNSRGVELRALTEGDIESLPNGSLTRQLTGSHRQHDDDTPFCCFPLRVLFVAGVITLAWSIYNRS